MSGKVRNTALFVLVAGLIVLSGVMQSWSTALLILNMGLVSAVMSLGVNLQWGFAGLFNVGIMGFVALGGLAAMLVSMPATLDAWAAGGGRVLAGLGLDPVTTASLSIKLAYAGLFAVVLVVLLVLRFSPRGLIAEK